MKIINFRGDLTDIPAKMEALPVQGGDAAMDEDEDDPLDAFMTDITQAVKRDTEPAPTNVKEEPKATTAPTKASTAFLPKEEDSKTITSIKLDPLAAHVKPEPGTEEPDVKPLGKELKQAKLKVRFQQAQTARKKALERSIGDVLNPYGSDSSASDSEDEQVKEKEKGKEGGGSDDDADNEVKEMNDEEWTKAVNTGKLSKSDRLVPADHSTIDYKPFRKVRFHIFSSSPFSVALKGFTSSSFLQFLLPEKPRKDRSEAGTLGLNSITMQTPGSTPLSTVHINAVEPAIKPELLFVTAQRRVFLLLALLTCQYTVGPLVTQTQHNFFGVYIGRRAKI